jgi:tetraprenyl-beta-curcumene synthase
MKARREMRAGAALVAMNARYWSTVHPCVRRQLRRWQSRARLIPDPALRALALSNLEGERFNVETAATLATLAPRRHRARATEAIVALQVAYDYLDSLSEQPAPDPLDNSRSLFAAFGDALALAPPAPIDYYRSHPHQEDGGYLQALVATCQRAFAGLPRATVVARAAREAMLRCGEGQSRTHAVASLGVDQLEDWATAQARGTDLSWWEFTAGATASVLAAHALIAAAADARTTSAQAQELDRAYFYICTLSTLLDSLIDHPRDVEEGGHSFISYYPGEAAKAEGVATVAARAAAGTAGLLNGSHHRMTATGVAAYYLSATEAGGPPASIVKARVAAELRPLITPILGIFHLWRLAKLVAARPMLSKA